MALTIKFDTENNPIEPTLVLATKSGVRLGAIPATDIVLTDNMNSYSEISFNVAKYNNGEEYAYWDKLKDFKVVWCREWDRWFEISLDLEESSSLVKKVQGVSLGEAELSQIMLYNIEINTEDDIARDDYEVTVLYDADNPEGSLLDRIMEKAVAWRVKNVQGRIATMQRTFTFDDISLYDAFQEIAEELNCIFIINSGSDDDGNIDRYISVYDLESYCYDCGYRGEFSTVCPDCGSSNVDYGYGTDTAIFVSAENLADTITFTTDTDSVKNCFKLEGGDDLMTATIRNCNPNGSDYIYYITDDVKEDMSDELVARIDEYDALYDYYQNEYTVYSGDISYDEDGNVSISSDSITVTDDDEGNVTVTILGADVADDGNGGVVISSEFWTEYNTLVTKYQVYNPDLEKMPSTITGYSALMTAYYNTIDLALYLQSTLMPDASLSDTSAAEEAALLTASNLSPVAVASLSSISLATANSAVLAMAKVVVDSRYQVKVATSSLSGTAWTGTFTVTNYSDEEDTATSASVSVTLSDDYEEYLLQMITKTLNGDDTEDLSITGLFEKDYDDFCAALKMYCLDSLTIFYDSCQACLNILIEQGVGTATLWDGEDPNLYDDLYLPYYNKLIAIEKEMELRQEEIDFITGVYDEEGNLITSGVQTIIETIRDYIQSQLDFEAFLGEELAIEFALYRREDKYSNENYISDGLNNAELFANALEFIETANKELYKSAELQHSISATLRNLLVMEEFQSIVDNFEVGNWLRVRVDEDIYRLRLLTYKIDWSNLSNLSITFSDVTKVSSGVSDLASVLSQATTMASSYAYTQRQASKGANTNGVVDNWFANGLDITNTRIVSAASNQTQEWDSNGILLRKYNEITGQYEDEQMRIINSTIAITNDDWLTVKTAIGKFYYVHPTTGVITAAYGVNAETIVGSLIIGEGLGIYNSSATMVFDDTGLTIDTSGGGSITIKNGDDEQLYIDSDGNLVLNTTQLTSIVESIDGVSSSIEQTANSITSTVQSAINNIDVGGTNRAIYANIVKFVSGDTMDLTDFISAGDITYTFSANADAGFRYDAAACYEASNYYTLSFYITKTSGTIENLYIYNGKSLTFESLAIDGEEYNSCLNTYNTGAGTLLNDGDRHRVVLVMQSPSSILGDSGTQYSYLQINKGSTTTCTVLIDGFKLEKGNIATAWSPAPEDMQSYTESCIKQLTDSITLSVTNGSSSSVLTIKSGSTTLSSATIQFTGVVTYTDLSTSGSTAINGSNITTGTISTGRIKLGGKMTVYQSSSSTTAGGYIGYMSGLTAYSDGSTSTTAGIAMQSTDTDNYIIATADGVRMQAGTGTFYIGQDSWAYLYASYFRVACNIRMSNGGGIYALPSSGGSTYYQLIRMGTDNYTYVGNTTYTTVVYGTPLYLNTDSYATYLRGSSIYMTNNMYITNGKYLYWYNTSGTACTMMIFNSSNNFYIGNAGYVTYLHGSSIYTNVATSVSSDERLKEDFGPLDTLEPVFDKLNGITFKYKGNDKTSIGFKYQDVAAAMEEAGLDPDEYTLTSTYEGEDGETYGSLAYSEFIALLVDKVQKLEARIEELENKLGGMEG